MSRSSNHHQLPNLEKLFKDEDDQDFAPIPGSNLAAIFGNPQKIGESFTPVKQSLQKTSSSGRSTPQAVQQANKTEVIIAKVVLAYKLQNGQYALIGKLGIALTASVSSRIYQIILYRSKQDLISVVTLSPEFSYTIRENNYATYYDGNNENWSLHFEDETSCVDFAREVGISRFNSAQTRIDDSVFHQNLNVDTGSNDAKENDEIHVKCIICTNLNQPIKFDDFSMEHMSVRISQYDNWERSLLNCSKGLKRLLILPPSKQISLGPGFPKEKEIIMEIHVIDVRKIDDKTSPVSKSSVHGGKASIISRMAKMGQSMLPKVPNSTTTESEDSEDDVRVKSPRRIKPEVNLSLTQLTRVPQDSFQRTAMANVLTPRAMVPSSGPLSHRPMIAPALGNPWTAAQIQQQYATMDGQYYPMQQAPVAQAMPVGLDPNLNVFLSETRTQNTEIRMGMAKIADNVQKLLDKFHVLEVQNASSPMILRKPLHHSVDEMVLNEDKFYGRETNVANGKNSSTEMISTRDEYRSKNSEREKKMEMELKEARELLEEYSVNYGKLNTEKQAWNSEKLELEKKIAHLEKTVEEEKNSLDAARDTATEFQEKNQLLESTISKMKTEMLVSDKSEHERTINMNKKTADIKRLMNQTYRMLLAKFTDRESYTGDFIKETLADTIRKITFTVLDDLQRDEMEAEISEVASDSSRAREPDEKIDTTNELRTISVLQEEPPPLPPMDEEFGAPDAYQNQ